MWMTARCIGSHQSVAQPERRLKEVESPFPLTESLKKCNLTMLHAFKRVLDNYDQNVREVDAGADEAELIHLKAPKS